MNTFVCRICSRIHTSLDARAECERRDIANRAWLTS